MKRFDLEERLIDFAANVILFTNYVEKNYAGNHLTGQIIRSSTCLLYTSPSPRDRTRSRMPSSA